MGTRSVHGKDASVSRKISRAAARAVELLESRQLLSAAMDLIGVTALRNDAAYAGIDGSGMSVAIIDTGIGQHSLLDSAVMARVDLQRGQNHPSFNADEQGHGTHVAGTVGARNGEIGVATGVGLIGLKIGGLDGSPRVDPTAVEAALVWVLNNYQQYNIKVVNMSLGLGAFSSSGSAAGHPLIDDVAALEQVGVTVVSAAGNEYDQNRQAGSTPPGIFSTLNVGAVYDENEGRFGFWGSDDGDFASAGDRTVYFSHRPNTPNAIFAPGANITSTIPNNRLDDKPGTSMAAPHVAGVVALMQEAAMQFGGRYLAPSEVQSLIINSADRIVDGDDEQTSVPTTGQEYPRVNAHKAVQAVNAYFNGTTPPPPDPTPGPDQGNDTDPDGLIDDATRLNLGQEPIIGFGIIGNDGATYDESSDTVTGGQNIGLTDVDIYELVIPDNGTLSIDTDTPASLAGTFPGISHADTYIRVFNASGTELGASDDAEDPDETTTDAHNTDSYLSVPVTRGQTIYVAVSSYNGRSYDPNSLTGRSSSSDDSGYYTLSFNYQNRDLNGAIPQATGAWTIDVSSGQPVYRAGIIGADGTAENVVGDLDVDFSHVNSPIAGVLEVDVDSTTFDSNDPLFGEYLDWDQELLADSVDTVISIWSADGTLLASIDDVDEYDPVIRFPIAAGVDYYISVSGYGNDQFDPMRLASGASGDTGNYAITYQLLPSDQTETFTDDSAASPSVRTISSSATLAGSLGEDEGFAVGAADVDIYRFVPDTTGDVTISTRDVTEFDADTFLRLFDANGAELTYNDDIDADTTTSRLTYAVTSGQTYYIGVNGYSSNPRSYDLDGNNATPGDLGDYALDVSEITAPVTGPDLVATVTATKLFNTLVPNDKGTVSVSVFNDGEDPISSTPVSANIYLSADGTVDGNDILIGSVTKTLSLVPGRGKVLKTKVIIPAYTGAGAYNLLAQVTSNATDTDLANNIASGGTRNVVWQFGTFAERRNVKLLIPDANGAFVQFRHKGPGYGQLSRDGDDIFDLTFIGTGPTSSATAVAFGSSSIDDITIDGSLKGMKATTLDLLGNVTTTGTRGPLVFRNTTV